MTSSDAQRPTEELPEAIPELDVVSSVDSMASQPPEVDVSRRAASGVVWLTLQKWATRLLGFVTIAVLTRALTPEDFGTVAAASTVLPFFFLLADLGFAAFIVQAEKVDQRMLSTAFWFSMGAGTLLCALLMVTAPLVGGVFKNPDVVPVLQALSLWVLVTAVGSVPMALLRRDMKFAALASQGTIAAVIAQIVAIAMAVGGLGVWALVGQALVAPVIATTLAWRFAKWRPNRVFARSELGMMVRFGGQVLGVEFVALARVWGEAAVISSVLGAAALGYMNVAQRLVQVVQDLTGSAIVPVSNVAFAKIRDSTERLREAYLRALRLTYAVLSLPLTIVAVTAPMLIPIVFGSGWEQSAQVAQILALAGTLSVGAWLDYGLYYGVGKPGVWFIYALVIDGMTFLATVLTVHWGLEAIAWGFLVVAVVATMVRWFMVSHLLDSSVRVIAGPFMYLTVVVLIAGGAGWAVGLATTSLPPLLAVIVIAFTVTVVHIGLTALMSRAVIRDVLRLAARTGAGSRLPWLRKLRS
ncbi:lipopolysaccharide biosynthesis protein [Microbacterium sp. B2969]|uniref:Lipopolysaccharide biosynthesis protein n=1 Tax=Microbacterium alkaliflavum TaxID=3248839 RepID=A0ABW7Q9N0_9MICO